MKQGRTLLPFPQKRQVLYGIGREVKNLKEDGERTQQIDGFSKSFIVKKQKKIDRIAHSMQWDL